MNKEEIIELLWKDARYAVNSLSKALINQTEGELRMALRLRKVDWEDVRDIDKYLIRDTLNNPNVLHKLHD